MGGLEDNREGRDQLQGLGQEWASEGLAKAPLEDLCPSQLV